MKCRCNPKKGTKKKTVLSKQWLRWRKKTETDTHSEVWPSWLPFPKCWRSKRGAFCSNCGGYHFYSIWCNRNREKKNMNLDYLFLRLMCCESSFFWWYWSGSWSSSRYRVRARDLLKPRSSLTHDDNEPDLFWGRRKITYFCKCVHIYK